MSIKDFMSPEQLEKYNSSTFNFLECSPEYQTEEITADDPEKIYAISGSGMSFMSKSEILRTTK